jgi:RNA polymerase-binding protein DksA
LDTARLEKIRERLQTERERLARELEEMELAGTENQSESSGENNYRDHRADQGTATFERELDMGLVDNTKRLLDEAREALERIDRGEYGECRRCGHDIPAKRIEAAPSAELCIECKEWEERS